MELSASDRNQLKEIYKKVKKLNEMTVRLKTLESCLERAIVIAERYGSVNNPLLDDLLRTRQEHLERAKLLPAGKKDFRKALADVRLFILGDLIGWFGTEN